VERIYTNLAVIDVTPPGLCVMEMIPGTALEKRQAMIGPKLQLAADWQVMAPTEAPEARTAQARFPRVRPWHGTNLRPFIHSTLDFHPGSGTRVPGLAAF
jgi:hypothetical protein